MGQRKQKPPSSLHIHARQYKPALLTPPVSDTSSAFLLPISYFLLPAFSLFLAAAARLSAFFSAEVCFALGSQLPFAPALVPATRLNPGQHACPLPELFFAVAIHSRTPPSPHAPIHPHAHFNAIEIE